MHDRQPVQADADDYRPSIGPGDGDDPGDGDAPPGPPYDARHSGLALGEAGAFLVLEDSAAAAARGATVLAEVRGHGDAFDASRGADETSVAAALARAVEMALELSGRAPAELTCVSASACVGFTLPGMIELPGSLAGRWSSPSPRRASVSWGG